MAFGLSTRAFIGDGPVEQLAKADALRTTARSWRVLSEAYRLPLIEQQLRPANDRRAAPTLHFDSARRKDDRHDR